MSEFHQVGNIGDFPAPIGKEIEVASSPPEAAPPAEAWTRGARARARPLYRQLRPSPKGLPREQVDADQRERLHGAMVEAVAANGYPHASVDQIVALAGVSTKSLYRHFGSKQGCFLATYDHVVREGAARIAAARDAASGRDEEWSSGLLRAFDAFVEEIVARPKSARLALVEVLAVGPPALGRIERSQALFEQLVAESLRRAPGRVDLPPSLVEGIVHGVWHVARVLLMQGRPERMRGLGGQLLDWLLCYCSPAVESLGELVGRGEPYAVEAVAGAQSSAGPLQTSDPRVAGRFGQRAAGDGSDERMRALQAAARIAARDGYEAVSLARIGHEAAVETDALLAMFGGAEQCFLSALDLASARVLARALEAARSRPCEGAHGFAHALRRALDAIIDQIAEDPALAKVAFVEVLHTGPSGARHRTTLLRRFADLLLRRAPGSHRLSPPVADAIVGAIWGVIHDRVVRGQAHTLPHLSDHVAYLALAPLIGANDAILVSMGNREPSCLG